MTTKLEAQLARNGLAPDHTPEARLKLAHDEDLRRHIKTAYDAVNGVRSDMAHVLELGTPDARAGFVQHWSEVDLQGLARAVASIHAAVEAAKHVKGA